MIPTWWILVGGGGIVGLGLLWYWWRHDPVRKALRTRQLPPTDGHGGRNRRRRMRRTRPLNRKDTEGHGHN